MIGLALVSTALVVGESVKATIGSTFEQSAKADYYVTDELDEVEFPATLVGEIRESDVVTAATGFTHFEARVDGTVTDVVGFDFDQIDAVLDLDVQAGGFDTHRRPTRWWCPSTRRPRSTRASATCVTVETANGSHVDATIVGLFDDQAILTEDYLFDNSVLADAGVAQTPEWLAVSIADGAAPADVDAFVADLSERVPGRGRRERRPSSVSGSRAWSTRC